MAKQISAVTSQVTLMGKVEIKTGDKVNYRDSYGVEGKGTVSKLWNVGDYGWMMVLDNKGHYECCSLALQLQHIGIDNILIKD